MSTLAPQRRRLFDPARPRLGDALAATLDWHFELDAPIHNPTHPNYVDQYVTFVDALPWAESQLEITAQEAWEALAAREVVPLAWHGDTRRRFAVECPRCFGEGVPNSGHYCKPCWGYGAVETFLFRCRRCGAQRVAENETFVDLRCACPWEVERVERMPHPGSVLACATLGSDPVGVETAEALAGEIAAAFVRDAPHGIGGDRCWFTGSFDDVLWRLHHTVAGRLGSRLQSHLGPLREYALEASSLALALAARDGGEAFAARRAALARKAAWRDALGPLLALLETGYALGELDSEGVTLYAVTL